MELREEEMKLPVSDDNAFHMLIHLRRHIKAKYQRQKTAAAAYGISVQWLQRMLYGRAPISQAMLDDAGITVTAQWAREDV
jgi:hypothetical protein